MEMEIQSGVEDVTKADILFGCGRLDTWNEQRTTPQLLGFIANKEALLKNLADNEEI